MAHIIKRPASATDTEFARSTHHRAYRDVSVRQFGPWDEEAQDEFFADGWSAAAHEIILLDGVPCGYACIEYRDSDIHVRELVIDPEFQGKGVGSHILREVIAHAGVSRIPVRLSTFHANHAVRLYRRLGFSEIGKTGTHILMEWRDG